MYPILRSDGMQKGKKLLKEKLGRKRAESICTMLATSVVWLATGVWHGANWTYIIWGMFNFCFLLFEHSTGMGKKWKIPAVLNNIYTMMVVTLGMVAFFSPDVPTMLCYIKQMFVPGTAPVLGTSAAAALFYVKDNILFFIAGIAFATPVGKKLDRFPAIKRLLLIVVFMISTVYILKGGYSPFIYFNF